MVDLSISTDGIGLYSEGKNKTEITQSGTLEQTVTVTNNSDETATGVVVGTELQAGLDVWEPHQYQTEHGTDWVGSQGAEDKANWLMFTSKLKDRFRHWCMLDRHNSFSVYSTVNGVAEKCGSTVEGWCAKDTATHKVRSQKSVGLKASVADFTFDTVLVFICNDYNSTQTFKNGYRRGRQCYRCRDCSRQFIFNPQN